MKDASKVEDAASIAVKYSDEIAGGAEAVLKHADDAADAVEAAGKNTDSLEELYKQLGEEWYRGEKFSYTDLIEKAKKVDVSTGANQAVFYSGKGNRTRAEAFALLNGKTTLEMTPGGKYFDSLKLFDSGSPVTKDQALEIWEILSERYAKAASGNTYGFIKGANPGSIFNTVEYPNLKNNPYISNIFTELFN